MIKSNYKQFIGKASELKEYFNQEENLIKHIGIQAPVGTKFLFFESVDSGADKTLVSLNKNGFIIGDSGILEFDNIDINSIQLHPLSDDTEIIVDFIIEEEEKG